MISNWKIGLQLCLLLVLAGCEVIKEEDRLIPVPTPVTNSRTHVLLEYTGFRCVNCPTAAQTARALQELYGEQLIVVALHPASNPFTQGLYDYTCPEADSLYLYMGGTATTPFPTGNIDLQATDNRYFYDYNEWSGELIHAMQQDTVWPYLGVTTETDIEQRTIDIEVLAYSERALDTRLAIWLVEDSIHGAQAMPDGSVNTEYIHRHVLRAAQNGCPWGEPILLQNTASQYKYTMPIPDRCNIKNCQVVALLLDQNNYRILQAYETNLDD